MQEVFTQFHPTLIKDLEMPTSLLELISSTGLLICGEMHGVSENADIAYTLVERLKIKTFLLEREQADTRVFVHSLKSGEPDWSALDSGVFTASVLSVEMAKTLSVLIRADALGRVVGVDPEGDEDFDKLLARNILDLELQGLALCVLGNWHTRIETEAGDEPSALQWLRKQQPQVPCLHYVYQEGSYFNQGTGLSSFDEAPDKHSQYVVRQVTDVDFELVVPRAHATRYRG